MRLDERGLTLVEVLAATAIIGIGLVGLMVVVPISSYGLQEGNQLSTATFLAEQRLEQVRNAPWTFSPDNDCLGTSAAAGVAPAVPAGKTCTNGSTTLAEGAATFADEASVASYSGYGRTVRVTNCAVTACAGITHADLRRVTVTVSYRPLTGVGVGTTNKSVALDLLVAKR